MFDVEQSPRSPTDVSFLVGEGSFSGDGRQPQIQLRMHIRHEGTFRWILRTFPGGKLYSSYLGDHVSTRFLSMCERYGIPPEK